MSEIRKAALPPKFQELRWVLMGGAPRYIVCGRAPVGLRRSSLACMDPEAVGSHHRRPIGLPQQEARSSGRVQRLRLAISDGEDLHKLPLSMPKASLARLPTRPVDGIFLSDFEQGKMVGSVFVMPA